MNGVHPPEFICKYSNRLIKRPAIIACGCCFDTDAIQVYLVDHDECPTCHQKLDHTQICKHPQLEARIEQYNISLEKQRQAEELCSSVLNGDYVKVKNILGKEDNPDIIISDEWMEQHKKDLPGYKSWMDHTYFLYNKPYSKWTLLHWAAAKGLYNIGELLLLHNASCEAQTSDRDTPLYLACEYGHANMVSLLIKHGANVNNAEDIQIAVEKEFIEIVKLLLKAGANASCETKHSVTPLHIAAEKGNLQIVELLLAHGADPHISDEMYGQPLNWALYAREKRPEHAKIIEILRPLGCLAKLY